MTFDRQHVIPEFPPSGRLKQNSTHNQSFQFLLRGKYCRDQTKHIASDWDTWQHQTFFTDFLWQKKLNYFFLFCFPRKGQITSIAMKY